MKLGWFNRFDNAGDYQYDVYRMMREYNGSNWEEFNPITNTMVRFHSLFLGCLTNSFFLLRSVAPLPQP